MSGWGLVEIRDLGNVVTGKTPKTSVSAYYEGGQIPFITPGDLEWRTFRVCQTESRVTQLALADYASSMINEGAVCVVCIGNTIGKCGIASEDSISNQQINSIEVSKEHDARFVYYALVANWEKVRVVASGSATPIVNKGKFNRIQIRVPRLAEQQKIASVLSAYDELIENNLKRIKLLEEKAQLTYEEWFVRMRFPGHESTPIDSATGLPEGWKKQPLSELTVLVSRGSAPKYVETDGYVVVNQKCIRDGRVQLEKSRLTSKEKKIRSDRFLQFADTLINSTGTGTAGRVGLFQGTRGPVTVDTHVTIVRADQDLMKFYIYAFLHRIEDELAGMARGSTNQVELAAKDINRISVVVPSDRLLAEYQSLVGKNFELVHGLFSANAHLGEARDILLPRLMTGMIDVEELDVELPMTA